MEQPHTREIFINRELSWLEFNRRVLDLAKDKTVPVGEQLKFAAIYASNLDEFFMVRVGSLYDRTLVGGDEKENKTGMTPAQQLDAIMPKVAELQQHCDKIVAKLYENVGVLGYRRVDFAHLSKEAEHFWRKYFMQEIFPVLSPQIIDRRHPFPFLRNNEVYVGTILKGKGDAQSSFGLVPISTQFQRIIFVPSGGSVAFALVEEMVEHFAGLINCACCKHRFNTFLAIVSGRTDFLNPSTADCWNHFVYICGSFSACNSSGRIQCFFKSVENAWKFRNAWKR